MEADPSNRVFVEILAELNGAGARYLIVGGYAFSHHVRPRATKDLDIWVEQSAENAPKVYDALARFGAPLKSDDVSVNDLARPGLVYQLGRAPRRVDVLTSLTGVEFAEAWASRSQGKLGDVPTAYLGAAQLLVNKRTVARPQDLADVAALERRFPALASGAAPAPRPRRKPRRK